jgi:DNA-directed RNA polymerase specialized sigma24 family protein
MTAKEAGEELLHEAVVRTFNGRRHWDPDRVDLLRFLEQAVRSIIYAEVRGPENRVSSLDGEKVEALEGTVADDPSVRGEIASEDERIGALIAAAGDDEFLLKVVDVILDGEGKAATIAERLAVDVKAVYQAIRKLKRRACAPVPSGGVR